jgi:Fe-S-cluster containining protein
MNEKTRVYLPFPDGIFHYVCRECTQNCCFRSAEFDGSLMNEIQQLVKLYPALEIMVIRRRGDTMAFTTPSGRCYFLDQDNRCGIETRHGKELKPVACRVFPFNHYSRLGDAFVAGLNFLCPLRIQLPARPGEVEGTHATIEAHLRESPYLEGGYFESVRQLPLRRDQKPAQVLVEESTFRDTCSRALGQQGFFETLRAASAAPDGLESFAAWAAGVLSLDQSLRPATRDHIDDLLLALASMQRLNLLMLTPEQRLRVLALGELVLRRLLAMTGDRPVGPADAAAPKGAYEILSRIRPVLHFLAVSDEPTVTGKKAVENIPPFGDADMTFAAFEILRAAQQEQPLTEVLERTLPPLSVSNRMALLMDLAGMIGPKPPVSKRKSRKQ